MIRLQLSIGEWLRAHGETILVFFRSWSRYFSFLSFHVFFDKLSNKLLWLFYLFVFFHMKLHFRVFLRIKTIQVSSGAILSFASFELTRTLTIYGDHGIMAHVPWWLSQSKRSNCIIQWFRLIIIIFKCMMEKYCVFGNENKLSVR